MEEPFARFHPVINFFFFIAVIVLGMFFVNPVFLAITLVFSILYYLLLKGTSGFKFLGGLFILFLVLTVVNPLFNQGGNTVLFTYFGGRHYTLESMFYGMDIAAMFCAILVWFGCYNQIMTNDKFIYMFGRFAPSISLVLTMALRLVPNYRRHANAISGARMCIGMSPTSGTRKGRFSSSMTILSALTSWALENGVMTGDSMRSRGYGTGNRTNFAIYRLDGRDIGLMVVMIACVVMVLVAAAQGATSAAFIPSLVLPPVNVISICGMVAYAVLLAIPSAIHVWEEITWRILRSRI